MSVEAVSAVLNHSKTKGSTRAVAVAMANRADEHGLCFPSVKDTAKRANCSPRTVQYALRKMEEMGELRILAGSEGGRKRTPLYYFDLPGLDGEVSEDHNYFLRQKGANLAPKPKPERAQPETGKGATCDAERAQTVAPESSKEPPSESSNTQSEEKPRQKVNGKQVTAEEYALAAEIITAFNQAAGTGYKPESIDQLRPVVGRIREFPELGAEDHRGIIAACFSVPWWTGAPGPQVIYGSRGQFERSIETWRAVPEAVLHVVEPNPDPAEFAEDRERVTEAWSEIAEAIRAVVPDSTFRLWIEPLQPMGASGGTILLGAPEGIRTWTERRYAGLIAEALGDHGGGWTQAKFCTPPDAQAAA